MIPARAAAASRIAPTASETDSSGVAGKRRFASAIRNISLPVRIRPIRPADLRDRGIALGKVADLLELCCININADSRAVVRPQLAVAQVEALLEIGPLLIAAVDQFHQSRSRSCS